MVSSLTSWIWGGGGGGGVFISRRFLQYDSFYACCSTTAYIITYAYYVRLDHVYVLYLDVIVCSCVYVRHCTLLSDGDLVVSVY